MFPTIDILQGTGTTCLLGTLETSMVAALIDKKKLVVSLPFDNVFNACDLICSHSGLAARPARALERPAHSRPLPQLEQRPRRNHALR